MRSDAANYGDPPDLLFSIGRGVDAPDPLVTINVALVHPQSRGRVRLRSADPLAAPIIIGNHVLVGTGNPEEGELRPQLPDLGAQALDRLGHRGLDRGDRLRLRRGLPALAHRSPVSRGIALGTRAGDRLAVAPQA